MASPSIGAGILAGLEKTVAPLKEAAVDVNDNIASADRVLRRYPESAQFADRFRSDYSQVVHAEASNNLQQELMAKDQAEAKGLSYPKINESKIWAEAGAKGRKNLLGPNDIEAVATGVKIYEKRGLPAAQNFGDTIAYMMRDRVPLGGEDPLTGEKNIIGYASSIKMKMQKAGVAGLDARATYEPKTTIENAAQSAVNTALIPLLAVPHTVTMFNGLLGTDPATWAKGAVDTLGKALTGQKNYWEPMIQTGVMAEVLMREVHYHNMFEASDRTFQYPGDSVVGRLYKMFHQPGFGSQRRFTLAMDSHIGWMTAEQSAQDLARNPNDSTAMGQLKQLDLDPQKILQQGGKLSDEDINKAIYAFVDNYAYVDNSLQRSRFLSATPTGRTLGMFHGYVNRQAKMMYKALFTDYRQRGAASVIRNLAIGSMLFPVMGEGVKIALEGIRGQDAQKDFNRDLEAITLQHGADDAIATYFEALSHVGAVGVYAHLMRGATHHALLNSIAGPAIGSSAELLEDTVSGLSEAYKHNGKHTGHYMAPVGRDLEYDTPYVSLGGQLLGNRLNPKKGQRHEPLKDLYNYIRDNN